MGDLDLEEDCSEYDSQEEKISDDHPDSKKNLLPLMNPEIPRTSDKDYVEDVRRSVVIAGIDD